MNAAIVAIIQTLIIFFLPFLLMKISRKIKLNKILGDIFICYGIGILLGNTKQFWLLSWLEPKLAEEIVTAISNTSQVIAYASVLLAIPLLLMLCNVKEWSKYTGKTMLAFVLGIISTLIASISIGYFFKDIVANIAATSGMMAGVYIGGTPNMIAVSKGVGASDQLFLLLSATDALCSGLYLFFLFSVGKFFFGLLLPNFKIKQKEEELALEETKTTYLPFPPKKWQRSTIQPLIIATLLGLGAIAFSAACAMAIPAINGELNQTILMLTLTTVGIALSFFPAIRNLKGVYNYAQYLLLIFGLAIGYLADFASMMSMGGNYLALNAVLLLCIIALHYLLAIIFKIDTDSFIISSTAALMGPPFIPQVASAIKNQELLPVGIALSILGLGLGNYAGIFVAWIVGMF